MHLLSNLEAVLSLSTHIGWFKTGRLWTQVFFIGMQKAMDMILYKNLTASWRTKEIKGWFLPQKSREKRLLLTHGILAAKWAWGMCFIKESGGRQDLDGPI